MSESTSESSLSALTKLEWLNQEPPQGLPLPNSNAPTNQGRNTSKCGLAPFDAREKLRLSDADIVIIKDGAISV